MFEELKSAGDHLQVALERYFRACSNARDNSLQGAMSRNSPKEYSGKIEEAVALAEAYDTRMQAAKQAIRMARNNAFYIAPINSLPSETLAQILYFVSRDDWSNVGYSAQVCSRWRSISVNTRSLWTYIYYTPHPYSHKAWANSLHRLELHISRAGPSPLDVHIYLDPNDCRSSCWSERSKRVFATISPRMGSLKLFIDVGDGPNHDLGGFSEGLRTLLSGRSQGSLKYFEAFGDFQGFIKAWDESTPTEPALALRVSRQQLGDTFASITVLHLNGLFFNWTSRIYHGLVDLCLSRSPFGYAITELQLRAVLKASPGLRTLYFSIGIQGSLRGNVSNSPINLDDLESLHAHVGMYEYGTLDNVSDLLRLIAPGPKPLELHLGDAMSAYHRPDSLREIEAFFARSNIVKLSLSPHAFFTRLSILSPNLKTLNLFDCKTGPSSESNLPSEFPTFTPKLDSCSINYCSLQLDDLLSKIDGCSREIIVKDSSFYRGGKEVDSEVVKQELLALNSRLIISITGRRVERTYIYD
ncbi:hypothetical protein FRC11_008218 [Ceratobasidium sp. 423]|nr:hypothetical protein FRC11_008218 [Ceratobasidium sp. 423]